MTTIEEIREVLAEMGRSAAESDKAWRESRAETERILAESRAETERILGDLTKKMDRVHNDIGGLNNSIGQLVQMVIIPGVMNKMNAIGHNFTMASAEKDYYKTNGDKLTDVDLLLENCQDVMVVEVKTTLTLNDIEHHLERLRLLRKNENITGMTGKTMYAAIACIRLKTGARELAVENGMYLIEIEEDNEKLSILPPEKVGTW
ncbi:MAG: hypothetical protein FWB94_07685 [Chitinispirillia bacterium]|nr:hypothetical protein [Chitinispirillia bacterium]